MPGSVLSGTVVTPAVASPYSWLAFLHSLSSTGSPPVPEFPDCIKPELAVVVDSTLGWCQDAGKLCFRLSLCGGRNRRGCFGDRSHPGVTGSLDVQVKFLEHIFH